MSDAKNIVEENANLLEANELLAGRVKELEQKLAEQKQTIVGHEADYDDLCQELEALRSDAPVTEISEEQDTEVVKEAEDVAETEPTVAETEPTVAEEVAKQIAQMGIAPVATIDEPAEPTRADVLKQFSALTDPQARGEFFALHRELIVNS